MIKYCWDAAVFLSMTKKSTPEYDQDKITQSLPVTTGGYSRCELLFPSCVAAAGRPWRLRERTAPSPGPSWQRLGARARRPASRNSALSDGLEGKGTACTPWTRFLIIFLYSLLSYKEWSQTLNADNRFSSLTVWTMTSRTGRETTFQLFSSDWRRQEDCFWFLLLAIGIYFCGFSAI